MATKKRRDEVAIAVDGLVKTYGPTRALDGLSFTVGWGSVTGFLGPNGAGKTTTLQVLLGLSAANEGTATIAGRRYADVAHPARVVGAVLDDLGAHPRMTGRRHLELLADAAGIGRGRVDEVLDDVGLTDAAGRRTGGYSLGMRRRLALAAAMLGSPRVLILDEPQNGLDPAGIRWLRETLRAYADRGNAVLVSSHNLREIQQMADDVVVIDHGRLVKQGSVATVARRKDLEQAFFGLVGEEA